MNILKPKIARKILRSLPKRFHAKITATEESNDIATILLTELIGNLQTYELGLLRIGKGSKSKNIALRAKNDEEDESSENENSKFKSYITKQFKKFIQNANVKANDKDHKQSGFSQYKSQERIQRSWVKQQHSDWSKMLWVSRVQTHEARVSYLSHANWQEKNSSCHLERYRTKSRFRGQWPRRNSQHFHSYYWFIQRVWRGFDRVQVWRDGWERYYPYYLLKALQEFWEAWKAL